MDAVVERKKSYTGDEAGHSQSYQQGVEAAHQSAYQSSLHPHVASGPQGGQFARKGQGGEGHPAQHSPQPRTAPAPRQRQGPMKAGDSGPDVRELNGLLAQMGLLDTHHGSSDQYGPETEAAVRNAQTKLGIHPNGHASTALLHKLQTAAALSPCVHRSEGGAVVDVIERAELSQAELNNLPDSAFAYIEPGGSKDSSGRTVPRSNRHFAIHDEAHVRNALARMSQSPFGDKAAKKIHAAAKKMGIGDHDSETGEPMGMDEPEHMPMRSAQAMGLDIVRAQVFYDRTFPLEDIEIVRAEQGGDGRTVEAYAAIWDTPAEVNDKYGHYTERIARSAFDKFINERGNRDIPVYFNHGMTAAGTPSDIYSVPIGRSLEIRAESRGLWTLSRYNDGPDADRVLEAIRNGAITAQSFRGRVFKSDPPGPIKRSRTGELPMVTRTELGLTEYGPTPSAVYDGASILALRSRARMLGVDLDELVDELARRNTQPTTPHFDEVEDEEPEVDATPDQGAGTDEPPSEALRSANTQGDIRRRIAAFRILGRKPQL